MFLAASPPVLALAVVMVELSFRALLVPFVGPLPLLPAGLVTAGDAAIAVPAIAVRADEEYGMALEAETNAIKEDCFAMNRRHA